ncbi:Mu transposase C-terminal domain-containing protein [Bradyrhizobium sp. NBAIM20]|uniref:Mu transposase C-terminal domain-containing protein n=1 Tax=unclassified Bradyrhizobium TaxID=2631580 RepID=UPI001CD4D013|nr:MULTISPECIES: Mu transposase C-terminal domain-containing protein [unclassified Bradyrhizobium]MCA1411710.1 Mu transposase C-terminal domain-containing protein [Bradyrhizobium sp. NBAIM20]MCA1460955.1 Mu transposase C-terminal domain-containing protein [Bradyrhizobium sp. NBAIM18]
MRNFIRNIINGLRGFIRNEARETAQEPVAGETIPALDEPVPAIVPAGSHLATLTPAGILFKGIRYYNSALANMLAGTKARMRVEARIKDPSDASSIFVWDDTARPAPRWITVPAVDIPAMSFAEHARLRDFARNKDLAFITEADRAKARELLREHWEKLAGGMPMRGSRQVRRDADDDIVKVELDQGDAAEPSPRERKQSKAAIAKTTRTKRLKTAEAKTKAPTRVSRIKRK